MASTWGWSKVALGKRRLVLASQSPQRRALVQQLDYDVEVLAPLLEDETFDSHLAFPDAIASLALAKAASLRSYRPQDLILGADTAILFHGRIFGKPGSRKEAQAMLETLSGQTHSVWTGVGIWDSPAGQGRSFARESRVGFKNLDAKAIDAYLDTGEWVNRAGAYAIQETGHQLVAFVEGSMDTIVGLPVEDVAALLDDMHGLA